MSLNKPDDIKKRLRKKGFELNRDLIDGHDAYVLVNPENGRYVYTYFSRGAHGRKALGNGLLHTMSEQLGFEKGEYRDFQRMIECKISGKEYVSRMKSKGLLNRKSSRRHLR